MNREGLDFPDQPPEQLEYKGHIITITLMAQDGGAWCGAFSIDGGPSLQALHRPTYFRQMAFDEALSAAKLRINQAG